MNKYKQRKRNLYDPRGKRECFEVILQANKDESRQAARQVTKLLYNSKEIDKYDDVRILGKTSLLSQQALINSYNGDGENGRALREKLSGWSRWGIPFTCLIKLFISG
jgi:hypothetical protein